MTNKNTSTTFPVRGISVATILEAHYAQSALEATKQAKKDEAEKAAIDNTATRAFDLQRLMAPRV